VRTFQDVTSALGPFRRAKVTVGTFDGVHRGHLRVLRELLSWARATDSDAVVLTFDRAPRSVLPALSKAEGSGKPAGLILSLPHRLKLLERLGLDAAIVLKFNSELAALEPEEFVREILVNRLKAGGVLLGHDTRFGRGGRGDYELMRRLGGELHFETCSVPVVALDGAPISSTRLRQAIRAGDLRLAERMLGHRVSVLGTVVPGTGRGRTIGVPTANLDLHHEIHPPQGVYATRTLLGGALRDSVTNIGRPPALKPGVPPHLSEKSVVETHVLDFSADLYGQDVEVQFIERIRAEEIFTSPEALRERIAADIRVARDRLAQAAPPEEFAE
jgi:riboflavin kinase/FMN adenylyltransferase